MCVQLMRRYFHRVPFLLSEAYLAYLRISLFPSNALSSIVSSIPQLAQTVAADLSKTIKSVSPLPLFYCLEKEICLFSRVDYIQCVIYLMPMKPF